MKSILLTLNLVSLSFFCLASPVLGLYEGGIVSRMFKNKDANEDAKISKKEFLAHAIKKFMVMDKNKDGYISAAEAKKYHNSKHKKVNPNNPNDHSHN